VACAFLKECQKWSIEMDLSSIKAWVGVEVEVENVMPTKVGYETGIEKWNSYLYTSFEPVGLHSYQFSRSNLADSTSFHRGSQKLVSSALVRTCNMLSQSSRLFDSRYLKATKGLKNEVKPDNVGTEMDEVAAEVAVIYLHSSSCLHGNVPPLQKYHKLCFQLAVQSCHLPTQDDVTTVVVGYSLVPQIKKRVVVAVALYFHQIQSSDMTYIGNNFLFSPHLVQSSKNLEGRYFYFPSTVEEKQNREKGKEVGI
jgi:hypothetical protein